MYWAVLETYGHNMTITELKHVYVEGFVDRNPEVIVFEAELTTDVVRQEKSILGLHVGMDIEEAVKKAVFTLKFDCTNDKISYIEQELIDYFNSKGPIY